MQITEAAEAAFTPKASSGQDIHVAAESTKMVKLRKPEQTPIEEVGVKVAEVPTVKHETPILFQVIWI